jgi:hypothetical protein
MALDIVATLLGKNPSVESINKVRAAIRKSYDYMRMTLDYAYGKPVEMTSTPAMEEEPIAA